MHPFGSSDLQTVRAGQRTVATSLLPFNEQRPALCLCLCDNWGQTSEQIKTHRLGIANRCLSFIPQTLRTSVCMCEVPGAWTSQ